MNITWLGKVVGGTFGFLLGGPLGALLGAAVGHQFDRKLVEVELLTSDFSPDVRHRVQMAFFTTAFSVMGHIAKADGRVTEAEIQCARSIMTRMELSEDMRRTAIHLFGEGKRDSFPLDATLDQFRIECRQRYSLLRMFVEVQLEAALADGPLQDVEERLLVHMCDRLRFSRFEFHSIKVRMEAERRFARYGGRQQQWRRRESLEQPQPSLSDAYTLLGVSASAGEGEIKRAYRKLMSQHHPDKLVANGLPDEMVQLATEKTQRIRKAYDLIAKSRNF